MNPTIQARTAILFPTLILFAGCMPLFGPCSGPQLDRTEFCGLPPAEQILTWRRLYENQVCIGHGQHFRFLDCIVKQGCPGADAVVPLLRDKQNTFLVEDAIYVVEFVHIETCNLRTHEALQALREVSESNQDGEVRQKALEVIQIIEGTGKAGTEPR